MGESLPNYIGPKRKKTLSNQASACTVSLKVAWSGISLIELNLYPTKLLYILLKNPDLDGLRLGSIITLALRNSTRPY